MKKKNVIQWTQTGAHSLKKSSIRFSLISKVVDETVLVSVPLLICSRANEWRHNVVNKKKNKKKKPKYTCKRKHWKAVRIDYRMRIEKKKEGASIGRFCSGQWIFDRGIEFSQNGSFYFAGPFHRDLIFFLLFPRRISFSLISHRLNRNCSRHWIREINGIFL